jgi:hypothetical protein
MDHDNELQELDGDDVVRMFGEDRADLDAPVGALEPVEVERRTLLATALVPSMFPATTVAVLEAVETADLPEDLREALARLPERTFENVQEIWVALGGPTEERDGSPALMERVLAEAEAAERRDGDEPGDGDLDDADDELSRELDEEIERELDEVLDETLGAARPALGALGSTDTLAYQLAMQSGEGVSEAAAAGRRSVGQAKTRLGGGARRLAGVARGAASVPLAAWGAAFTLGAGVLQRCADDLTAAAARVAGPRH